MLTDKFVHHLTDHVQFTHFLCPLTLKLQSTQPVAQVLGDTHQQQILITRKFLLITIYCDDADSRAFGQERQQSPGTIAALKSLLVRRMSLGQAD